MLMLSAALLLTPAALADVAPGDTSEEEEEEEQSGEEGQEGESEDTAIEAEDKDDGCSTVAASASLLGVGVAAFMVGWRRES